jgi:hypothetical protein
LAEPVPDGPACRRIAVLANANREGREEVLLVDLAIPANP